METMRRRYSFLHICLSLAIAVAGSLVLTLSGCGGGGGNGTSASSEPTGPTITPTILPRNEVLSDATRAGHLKESIGKAAEAEPNPGSVTQSSNIDTNNITIDQVEASAQYGDAFPQFSIENGSIWTIRNEDGNPTNITGFDPPSLASVQLSKRLGEASLYVDAYTDRFGPDISSYLSLGAWMIIPDDAESAADYTFGAFADGSDPYRQENLASLAGVNTQATYEGNAVGTYAAERLDDSTQIGRFSSEVRITAYFGNDFGDDSELGIVGGWIHNFEWSGGFETDKVDELFMHWTNIGLTDSGFARGTISETDAPEDDSYFRGNFGLQFFGNPESDDRAFDVDSQPPGLVAGTFGVTSTDDNLSLTGAFYTRLQP